jgi:hypothetical protein
MLGRKELTCGWKALQAYICAVGSINKKKDEMRSIQKDVLSIRCWIHVMSDSNVT